MGPTAAPQPRRPQTVPACSLPGSQSRTRWLLSQRVRTPLQALSVPGDGGCRGRQGWAPLGPDCPRQSALSLPPVVQLLSLNAFKSCRAKPNTYTPPLRVHLRMKLTPHMCSVMANSLQPHGPARLLCPWNFPGKI